MHRVEIVKAFFEALERSDDKTAKSLLHQEAVVWHNFDMTEKPFAASIAQIGMLKSVLEFYGYAEGHYESTENGVLVRHILVAKVPGGPELRAPTIVYVTFKDDKIVRAEEYVDTNTIA